MTALVPRDVERTFSEVARFSTGLPLRNANYSCGEYFGQFRKSRSILAGIVG